MGKVKVLIVEDDSRLHKLYNKSLRDEEYDKKFSENGVDALECYKSWAPDIVILDIGLPEMDGYSVLKKIRKEIKDEDTTIIMATVDSDGDRIHNCVMLGISDYIKKPFKYEEINTKVKNAYKWGKIPNAKY